MKKIYYAGGSVLTTASVAEAVLDYAEALGRTGRADVVEVPILSEDGRTASATLLIGPSSQLMAVPADPATENIAVDPQVVADLERRASLIGKPRPMSQQADETSSAHDDYE